jgi:hypothetical protein
MSLLKKIAITLFGVLLSGAVLAKKADPSQIDKDIRKATRSAINTYKKSGVNGLTSATSACYKKNKTSLNCLYLDMASRTIDQAMAQSMGWPSSAFYSDAAVGPRVAPVFKEEKVDMNTANQFLQAIAFTINDELNKKW